MNKTDMPGGDYLVTHHPANTDPAVCQAACAADAKCNSWTYVIRGTPAGSGDCCLKSTVPCPTDNAICTSGGKLAEAHCEGNTGFSCTVSYTPPSNASAPFYEVPVKCGGTSDTLRLTASEQTVEIRALIDWTFVEAYFQSGRVAMTVAVTSDRKPLSDDTGLAVTSTAPVTAQSVVAYPIKGIWTTADEIRKAPRVYPAVPLDSTVSTIV